MTSHRSVSGLLGAALLACAAPAQGAACATGGTPLLTSVSSIAGARSAPRPPAPPAPGAPMPQFGPAYLPWLAPAALATRANYLFVADSGRRHVVAYDLAQQTVSVVAPYPASGNAPIAAGPDLSLYVGDQAARRVLHYGFDGRALAPFENAMELARPVGLALDQAGGKLLVADGLYKHVVVFGALGRVMAALRPEQARSIDAMAHGPDGLYLADRLARQVAVIGLDGADQYTLGPGTLRMPAALAVDRHNRVFVADAFDGAIKVFAGRQELAADASAPRFTRIAALVAERDLLYVADAGAARIAVLRVAPPCAGEGDDAR